MLIEFIGRAVGRATVLSGIAVLCCTSIVSAQSIFAGPHHTMVVNNAGIINGFGYNANAHLGSDAAVYKGSPRDAYTPVPVTGLTDVMAVTTSGGHTIALKKDGTIWAWGWNSHGQVGNGTLVHVLTPVQITPAGQAFVAIASGSLHSVALRNDGTVWTWGYNGSGQLGIGTTDDPSNTLTNGRVPTLVPGLTGVIAIAAGDSHTVAMTAGGNVWAWGANERGQLGNCNGTVPPDPGALTDPPTVTERLGFCGGQLVGGRPDNSATPLPVAGLQ